MARFRRVFLIVMMLLSLLATALALGALWVYPWSRKDWVLASATGDGILLAACFAEFAAMERRLVRWVAISGFVLAIPMLVAIPAYLWIEQSGGWPGGMDHETLRLLGRLVATGMVIACLFCLLAFVLAPRMRLVGGILQWATVISLVSAAGLFQVLIWGEWPFIRDMESAWMASLFLSAGGTIAVWAWYRLSAIRKPDRLSVETGPVHVRCPRCQKEQELAVGESRCAGCGLRFKIEVEEPRCPKCGYNLHGLTGEKCPECGTVIVEKAVDPNAGLLAWARANDQAKGDAPVKAGG